MTFVISRLKGLEIDENDTVLSEFVDPVLLEVGDMCVDFASRVSFLDV